MGRFKRQDYSMYRRHQHILTQCVQDITEEYNRRKMIVFVIEERHLILNACNYGYFP